MVHRRPGTRPDRDVACAVASSAGSNSGGSTTQVNAHASRVDQVQPLGDLDADRAEQRPRRLRPGRRRRTRSRRATRRRARPGRRAPRRTGSWRPARRASRLPPPARRPARGGRAAWRSPARRPACARLRRAARHDHRADVRRLEHAERRVLEVLGALDEFQAEPQVGLVRAEPAHRVGVGHPRQWRRHVVPDQRPQRRDDLLGDRDDVLGVDEAHLHVELGELRLPVGAEVLVAVAAGDLVVALHARDHQQLLEQLRTLRQRVERPGLQPRRHQEVAGTLRASTGSSSASRSRRSRGGPAPRARRH